MSTVVETNYFGNFKQEEEPKVTIIPIPYEYTTSYNKGTKDGPQAILNASIHLEQLDEELWKEITQVGINTSKFISCEFVTNKTKEPFNELEEVVRGTVISGCIPVIIGGEHTVSYGAIKAIYDLFPDVSILYFDSRPNLKATSKNNKFNHLCTLRRIYENMPELKILQLGIRSISKEESSWLESANPNIEMFFAKEKERWKISDILSNLTKNVYISFDFSVLDLGIMPTCTIPEPGGLSFEQTLDILRNVCTFKEIVGMDFVEFVPSNTLKAPDILAAKLIYKTIGYSFAREMGVFEESEKSLISSNLTELNLGT